MKKYVILSFKDFENNSGIWNDEGGTYSYEEAVKESKMIDPKYKDIRLCEVESEKFGVSQDCLKDFISDKLYDEAGDDIHEIYQHNIESTFNDNEVKNKLEELADLLNKKMDIKYYNFAPWEAIKIENK